MLGAQFERQALVLRSAQHARLFFFKHRRAEALSDLLKGSDYKQSMNSTKQFILAKFRYVPLAASSVWILAVFVCAHWKLADEATVLIPGLYLLPMANILAVILSGKGARLYATGASILGYTFGVPFYYLYVWRFNPSGEKTLAGVYLGALAALFTAILLSTAVGWYLNKNRDASSAMSL